MKLQFQVDRDGHTGKIQLNIGNPNGCGFRLGGPKYNGSSKNLLTVELTKRDADEIRQYLDASFPVEGVANES